MIEITVGICESFKKIGIDLSEGDLRRFEKALYERGLNVAPRALSPPEPTEGQAFVKLEEARKFVRNLWRNKALREREHYDLIALIDATEKVLRSMPLQDGVYDEIEAKCSDIPLCVADRGEFVLTAASYALRAVKDGTDTPIFAGLGLAPLRANRNCGWIGAGGLFWPWQDEFPWSDDRRTRLLKAAAYIVAEIQQIDAAPAMVAEEETKS